MIAALLLLLLLLGAPSTLGAGIYPIQKAVLYDPKDFQLLYYSTKGAFQENWSFAKTVRLTAFILASQVNLCGGSKDTYRENVTLTVSKVESGRWTLLAEAKFDGEVRYGQELRVSMLNHTTDAYPQFFYGGSSFYYAVRVVFGGAPGLYPWRTTRDFSGACATTSANTPGHIIGMEYTW